MDELFNKRGERYSHRRDYKGTRTKGRRVGTLWYSITQGEGDVTFNFNFEELYDVEKVNTIQDFIGMLEREKEHWLEKLSKEIEQQKKAN